MVVIFSTYYNVMIDGKNFLDQPRKNDKVTCENITKIATSQGDDYSTVCLLDYTYFKKYYKMIAVDLSKQQALDGDPAGTRHPRDIPWRSPKGPNIRDLQGTFMGLLGEQQQNWWFNENSVFYMQ